MNVSCPSCSNFFQAYTPKSSTAQKLLYAIAIIFMIGGLVAAGCLFSKLGYGSLGLGVAGIAIGGLLITLDRGCCSDQEESLIEKISKESTTPTTHLKPPAQLGQKGHMAAGTTQGAKKEAPEKGDASGASANKPQTGSTVHPEAPAGKAEVGMDAMMPIFPEEGTHFTKATINGQEGRIINYKFRNSLNNRCDITGNYNFQLVTYNNVACCGVTSNGNLTSNPFGPLENFGIPPHEEKSFCLPIAKPQTPIEKPQNTATNKVEPQPMIYVKPQEGVHYKKNASTKTYLISSKLHEKLSENNFFNLWYAASTDGQGNFHVKINELWKGAGWESLDSLIQPIKFSEEEERLSHLSGQ